jgi:death on curing protein
VTPAVEHLDLEDLLFLATELLGDPPPLRDVGLLEAAVARPRTTVFGEDAYSDLWTKAAALLQSLVGNHALVDGNKRLGWTATAVFLELNDIPVVQAEDDAVYDLVMAVASSSAGPVDELAAQLRRLVEGGGA